MGPLRGQRLTWSISGAIHQFGAVQPWLHECDYGTRSTAKVDSTEPLWDQPQRTQEMHAGQHWLLFAAHGRMGVYCVRFRSNVDCGELLVADGVSLPKSATGPASHSWWVMVILLFAHIQVAMAVDIYPPTGAALPRTVWPVLSALLLILSASAVKLARAQLKRGRGQTMLCLLLFMGSYLLVRSFSGRLQANAPAALDSSWLVWLGVTAQGLAGTGAVQWIARAI